jgi:Fe-Mn family superoxide dismutase
LKNNIGNEKSIYFNIVLLLLSFVVSCNNKKLTEVVSSVTNCPRKVTIGFPEDVKANKGSFQLENYLIDMMH